MPNAHRSVLAHDAHSLIGCCTHDGGSTLGHAMPRARNAKRSQERLGTRCLLYNQLLHARLHPGAHIAAGTSTLLREVIIPHNYALW
jgi:hypothetical protein